MTDKLIFTYQRNEENKTFQRLYSSDGSLRTIPEYAKIEKLSDEYFSISFNPYESDREFGLLNNNLEEITKCQFYNIELRNDGLFVVRNKKYNPGLIDKQGNIILEIGDYDAIYTFQNGLSKIRNNNRKYAIIDISGTFISDFIYDHVNFYDDIPCGIAEVCKEQRWGIINEKGNEVVPCVYSSSIWQHPDQKIKVFDFSNHFAKVSKGSFQIGEAGYINSAGKEIVSGQLAVMDFTTVGTLVADIDSYAVLLDSNGNELFRCSEKISFNENTIKFIDGLARVSIKIENYYSTDKKFGYINEYGKLVIPYKYTKAEHFENGLAFVCYNNENGYIDKHGYEYWQ